MRRVLLASLPLWPSLVLGAVLNVEFKFTPFTGDLKADQVEAVPGQARVFLNGVPYAEQEVRKQSLPVLFEEREIAASVWMPAASMGPGVRKGKNTIRIEFEPADAKAAYRAQLRWAAVMDQAREEKEPGHYQGTNQADEGVDDKPATGKVVFEREFVADFARDLPWHHYPAVTALGDDDKQRLAALVSGRAEWFKPDFAPLYKALEGTPELDVAGARKAKCLDAAYAAGVRIAPPPADDLEFVTTGRPEVVVRRKGGHLFAPDPAALAKIKGEEAQMCAEVVLSAAYPPRLVVVHAPSGAWEVVY